METRPRQFMALTGGVGFLIGITLYLWATGAEAAPQACRKGFFPASGQTTPYQADINDGGGATDNPVDVPDDGTVQAGKPLSYRDNGDGTITDLNAGLIWEKKGAEAGLHNVDSVFSWSNDATLGSEQDPIWDWLADVNAEGGTGFAGHSDWRIPNVKELVSILNYENPFFAVAAAFNNGACSPGGTCTVLTCSCTANGLYWSSTTGAGTPAIAWGVNFGFGNVLFNDKSSFFSHVRAVRGGCVD